MKYKVKHKVFNADTLTPVGAFLVLRDIFPDCQLLESSAHEMEQGRTSIIACGLMRSIEVKQHKVYEVKDGRRQFSDFNRQLIDVLDDFKCDLQREFETDNQKIPDNIGLIGFIGYDAVKYFEPLTFNNDKPAEFDFPDMYFGFYRYYFLFDHAKHHLKAICFDDGEVQFSLEEIVNKLKNEKYHTTFFKASGEELCNENHFTDKVNVAKNYCKTGDVFQVVLSKQFKQKFEGDDFNVYRQLRFVNPSPYMFYFSGDNYNLFGASPETHLRFSNGKALINPIAGTIKRTGNEDADKRLTEQLLNDPKEHAEHDMLIDLARNDLSNYCTNVTLTKKKELKKYSHVFHLVSEVEGTLKPKNRALDMLARTFPAGTLSGAPKFRAMQIIDELEQHKRQFYGGAIGVLDFNNNINLAIMIRTFISHNHNLTYCAGAGITINSNPDHELKEVNNKINALRNAIAMAQINVN